MASIFLTGATGYIGGQALKDIIAHRREYASVRVLVRNYQAAKKVAEAFPQVQIVSGNLDDVALIEDEAAKAGIVLHLASNKHMDSVRAIHRGLLKREAPSYWIQVSGASALAAGELASGSFQPGEASADIYDDKSDIDKILSLIRAHPSRAVDYFVLDVTKNHPSIRTAIVMPPIVYGKGEGPGNQRSIQIPALARVTIERGRGVRLFADLADAGANGSNVDTVWGDGGIYLPSAAEISFGELSERVAQAAHKQGLIKTTDLEEVDGPHADKLLPGGSVFFGTNARIESTRAAEELGWNRTMKV